jgi:hypothetical protein
MHFGVAINLYFKRASAARMTASGDNGGKRKRRLPDVLVNKNRAFVRFARPSMFKVPWNDVLIVFTALN